MDMHAKRAEKFREIANRPFRLRLFFLNSLPMAWLVGLKIQHFKQDACAVSVRLKYLTKNPFRSVYFACLSMAAELSTGLLAMQWVYKSPVPVSMLITSMHAEYFKKSTGKITFKCLEGAALGLAYQTALDEEAGSITTVKSIGLNAEGEKVAEFTFTWSFRLKGKLA